MKKVLRVVALILAASLVPAVSVLAQEVDPDLTVDKARIVLKEMTTAHDRSVPIDLLAKSSGVAIVPALYKGGFVVGGAYGHGVILAHKAGTWSGPAFFRMGMASVGFQIGLQSVQLIMVVVGEDTMDAFLKSKFTLGGDVAVAAGPIGARASAATEIKLKGGVYSYSRTKGLFAGISLEGAGVDAQPDLNQKYYGAAATTADIFEGRVTVPESGQQLIQVLEQYKE